MNELYKGYSITPVCNHEMNGRYSVGLVIEVVLNEKHIKNKYCDSRTTFILEKEAEIESINYGKRLIDNGLIK